MDNIKDDNTTINYIEEIDGSHHNKYYTKYMHQLLMDVRNTIAREDN